MIEGIFDKKINNIEFAQAVEEKRRTQEEIESKDKDNIITSEDLKKDEQINTEEAVERIISVAKFFNRKIHLEIEEELGITIVKIIDSETEKVIRQIPPEELVELSKHARNLKGLLINKEG
jgi:flagellar protein FlaG